MRVSPRFSLIRARLLEWYRRHGRHDLPWRGSFDPYSVLVSEYMLQQTTVATVIPYFHRFLKSFPTVHHLARASLDNVLKHWAGLGYYARARNLHRAAQILVQDFGGQVPRERAQAETLPGVGPYTAGALLSFAHNRAEALVDGNVIRVLSRVFGVKGDTRRPAVLNRLWTMARALVPMGGARHFNSALMDFGATLCRSGLPECADCPLRRSCWAFQHGWVDRLPAARPDAVKRRVQLASVLIPNGGRLALRRRPLGGLWGGLWELPMLEGRWEKGETAAVGGLSVIPIERWGTLRHVLSHRDLRVDLWRGRLVGPARGVRWVGWAEARRMAISNLTKKLLELSSRKMVISSP